METGNADLSDAKVIWPNVYCDAMKKLRFDMPEALREDELRDFLASHKPSNIANATERMLSVGQTKEVLWSLEAHLYQLAEAGRRALNALAAQKKDSFERAEFKAVHNPSGVRECRCRFCQKREQEDAAICFFESCALAILSARNFPCVEGVDRTALKKAVARHAAAFRRRVRPTDDALDAAVSLIRADSGAPAQERRQQRATAPITAAPLSASLRTGKLRQVIEALERGGKLTASSVNRNYGRPLTKLKCDARNLKDGELSKKVLSLLNSIPSS